MHKYETPGQNGALFFKQKKFLFKWRCGYFRISIKNYNFFFFYSRRLLCLRVALIIVFNKNDSGNKIFCLTNGVLCCPEVSYIYNINHCKRTHISIFVSYKKIWIFVIHILFLYRFICCIRNIYYYFIFLLYTFYE